MYTKILCFNILIFFYSFYNIAETCCQTITRVFGDENINMNALSIEDIAKLKLIFEYFKKNEITEIEYQIYKYIYNEKDPSKITIFEKKEKEFEKVKEFSINSNENDNILNLFNFTNNEKESMGDKINIKENNAWCKIDEIKKYLRKEKQELKKKEKKTNKKKKISKILNIENINPEENGIYIIKIKFQDDSLNFIFIDYMVTIGETNGYYYDIKKIFVRQEDNFKLFYQKYKIKKSIDGELNKLNFFL